MPIIHIYLDEQDDGGLLGVLFVPPGKVTETLTKRLRDFPADGLKFHATEDQKDSKLNVPTSKFKHLCMEVVNTGSVDGVVFRRFSGESKLQAVDKLMRFTLSAYREARFHLHGDMGLFDGPIRRRIKHYLPGERLLDTTPHAKGQGIAARWIGIVDYALYFDLDKIKPPRPKP